jgi:multidrug resistance efflux pump
VPTAPVKRGRVELAVYAWGDVRPSRVSAVVAPDASGALQIVRIAPTGTRVRAGEIVCELDPAEQQHRLEESLAGLREAEQERVRVVAEGEIERGSEDVERLAARFSVRRAEMDVARNELVSDTEAREHDRALAEARRHLARLDEDFRAQRAARRAAVESAEERVRNAQRAVRDARENIEKMKLRAEVDGFVVAKENTDAWGAFVFNAWDAPPYRMGDTVASGRTVAEIVRLDQMEIRARIPEGEGAGLRVGAPVVVEIDAAPSARLAGTVKEVAGMATRQFYADDGRRKFDVRFEVGPHPALRPGATARVTAAGGEVDDAVYIPRQAVFEEQGRTIVYLQEEARFRPLPVTVTRQSESHAVVDGLSPGARVALSKPPEGLRP